MKDSQRKASIEARSVLEVLVNPSSYHIFDLHLHVLRSRCYRALQRRPDCPRTDHEALVTVGETWLVRRLYGEGCNLSRTLSKVVEVRLPKSSHRSVVWRCFQVRGSSTRGLRSRQV